MIKLASLVLAVVLGAGALGLTAAPVQAGVVLQVVGGKLVGAKNVDVQGTLYDVQFLDGRCSELYSGCDEASDFYFHSYSNAAVAAQTLLNLVFTDSGLGQFDSASGLTEGCSSGSNHCAIFFPYAPHTNPSQVNSFVVVNYSASGDYSSYTLLGRTIGSFGTSNTTWALFSLAAVAVPEPSTLLLFGFGLLGLVGLGWRRRQV